MTTSAEVVAVPNTPPEAHAEGSPPPLPAEQAPGTSGTPAVVDEREVTFGGPPPEEPPAKVAPPSLEERLAGKPAPIVCEILGEHLEALNGETEDGTPLTPELWSHLTTNDLRLVALTLIGEMGDKTLDLCQEVPPKAKERVAKQREAEQARLARKLAGWMFMSMTAEPADEFCKIRLAVLAATNSYDRGR